MKDHKERIVAAGVAVTLIAAGVAIFRARGAGGLDSLWQYLLEEGVTRGSVRLLVVALSLYGIVSVPVLVFRGRWIRSLGPSGVSVDEAAANTEGIAEVSLAIAELAGSVQEMKLLLKERSRGTID